MKKLFTTILLLSLTSISFAADKTTPLSKKISTILKNFGDTVSIGILVKDQKTGETLYSKNAAHYFMPASNEKLFTAFSALDYLDKDFTYKTQLFVDTTKIQNGILNDNVYLQFSGDPTFTLTQLDNLIRALKVAGVNQINGNIVIDDSAFDQVTISPGSTWDDKDYCWGAPVNAINVQGNCVVATIAPAKEPGALAIMSLPDFPQSMQFINTAKTGANNAACILDTKRTSPSSYTISGCVQASSKPQVIAMAIDNPRVNLQFLLFYLLNKNQISNTQNFRYEKAFVLPNILATESSLPLLTLITTMMKESDNGISNSLFKTMGSLNKKESGSFENGSETVRNILSKSLQIEIPKTTLIDGNGGSRYDFLTPEQIVMLLQKTYNSRHAKNFIAALPIGGVDGTLKARMKDASTHGNVFAKTGSETAVNTLSGYLQTQKKHTLVFSIMINGFVDLPNRYQDLQDQLCAAMIENG